MCNLLRGVVLEQAKIFFGKIVNAAIRIAVDDTDINADQLGVDANDIAFRNFFGSVGRIGGGSRGSGAFALATEFGPLRWGRQIPRSDGLTPFGLRRGTSRGDARRAFSPGGHRALTPPRSQVDESF